MKFLKELVWVAYKSYMDMGRVNFVVTFRTWARYIVNARILRSTKRHDKEMEGGEHVVETTIDHNQKGYELWKLRAFSGFRPHKLLRIVATIEVIDRKKAQLLFIGPRAESELFIARSYGFKKQNIRGLDLFSYSKMVDLGDMHEMPYEDSSKDVIIMGWVLAYSKTPEEAAKEVVRVAKNGAIITVGVQYHPRSPEDWAAEVGYMLADYRIESTKEILSYFGDAVDHVYFDHILTEKEKEKPGEFMVTFSVKK